MSVFTPLERNELEAFLAPYRLGRLVSFQGIPAGAENSNFFIDCEAGEFVLTLIERGEPSRLPLIVALLTRLAEAGLAVPYALATAQGERIGQLAAKPALLQPRLAGAHVLRPVALHCQAVGQWLGKMHALSHAQPLELANERGLEWMLSQGPLLALELEGEELALLRRALSVADECRRHWQTLPQGNLHADLFRDNVLFEGPQLSGVIDFYNACSGPLLFDLAITLNDWCSRSAGSLDPARCHALLAGYASQRPLQAGEAALWPQFLVIAALRFWLSRLLAARAPKQPGVLVKAPQEFALILKQRLDQLPPPLPLAF